MSGKKKPAPGKGRPARHQSRQTSHGVSGTLGDSPSISDRKPVGHHAAPPARNSLFPPGGEMLAGVHPVREALKALRRRFYTLYLDRDDPGNRILSIVSRAREMKIPVETISTEALDAACMGVRHQGIAAAVGPLPMRRAESAVKQIDPAGRNRFILILESIEDPHNLGALIRTALCAGVDHIVLPRDRAVSPTPAVSRASAGALEHADLWSVTNTTTLIEALKKQNFWVAGLDAGGKKSLFEVDLTGDIALVVGGEHKGIRPRVAKACDFMVSLPMGRGITSLNASVAGGIAMYEILRQRSVS